MDIPTSIKGVLQERSALQDKQGVSNPTYISEHMQLLAQYVSVLEEHLAEEKKKFVIKEANLFKDYTKEMSFNAASNKIKYELAEDSAEVERITRLVSSSWRLIGVSQSRVKHLVEESKNQI